jgi:hypothetical protein
MYQDQEKYLLRSISCFDMQRIPVYLPEQLRRVGESSSNPADDQDGRHAVIWIEPKTPDYSNLRLFNF